MRLMSFTMHDGRQVRVNTGHIVAIWPRTDGVKGSVLDLDNGKTRTVIQTVTDIAQDRRT